MGTYVYGVTAAAHPALPEGTAGVGDPPRRVRVLTEGELAALVSEAPDGLRPGRRDRLAHQNVLAVAGCGGCVLPMRFGSVAPDDDTVTGVLAERADHYRERLRTLDGKVEYNVRVSPVEEAVLHRVMSENPELRALAEASRKAGGGSHRSRLLLGEMVVDAVRVREATDAAEVRQELEPESAAVSAGTGAADRLVDVSFLVDRHSAETFLAGVERLRRSHPHLDLSLIGPLPPYSFVEPGPAEPAVSTAGRGPRHEEDG
ncbi:GvpL/GvpF family gas vesicle protein [Streptomyces sp. NPDC094038]|uniref:GvpL/GvpF family gas vesicle protein n=1 Tax=Streptomyces sp. NPDC094038 TaxID=3366055 RepID=UPI00382C9CB3